MSAEGQRCIESGESVVLSRFSGASHRCRIQDGVPSPTLFSYHQDAERKDNYRAQRPLATHLFAPANLDAVGGFLERTDGVAGGLDDGAAD